MSDLRRTAELYVSYTGGRMPKTTQMGFLVLGALLLAAIFVVALVLLLNVGIIQGLVLLAIIDALIIMGGYLMTKRIARANQRDTGP